MKAELLVLGFIVLIAIGGIALARYERYRKKGHTPKRPVRGDGWWTDAEGYDHDWHDDPPNGRVVIWENKYGKNPTGPKK